MLLVSITLANKPSMFLCGTSDLWREYLHLLPHSIQDARELAQTLFLRKSFYNNLFLCRCFRFARMRIPPKISLDGNIGSRHRGPDGHGGVSPKHDYRAVVQRDLLHGDLVVDRGAFHLHGVQPLAEKCRV